LAVVTDNKHWLQCVMFIRTQITRIAQK